MTRIYLAFFIFLSMQILCISQDINVHKNDGSVENYELNEVKGISFDTSEFSCGDVWLGGFQKMDDYDGAPLHEYMWKAFRFQAIESGNANCIKIFLKGLIGDRTDDEVGAAIYDDNSGLVGNLKVWGYVEHYDWTEIGTWQYHSILLNRVETNRVIESGNYYWITVHSSGHADVLIERGGGLIPGCTSSLKRGANQPEVTPPPQGSSYTVVYDPDCYGWSLWQ